MRRFYLFAALLFFSFQPLFAQPLYYHSATSGNWNQASTWEVSNDLDNWTPASSPPDAANPNTLDITIRHTVTVSTNVTADQVFVDTTGRLRITASTYTVANSGQPFDIIIGGALELTGGQIIGAGKARIQKIMDWSGGTNAVNTQVDSPAVINITGTVNLNNIMTVNGTVNHIGGSIFFQNGTVNLHNIWYENPGSTNQFGNTSGVNLFVVSTTGTLYKLGNQTFVNNVPTTIAGGLDIQEGFYIGQAATVADGFLNIKSPGTFQQSGNVTFNPGAGITGRGNYHLASGTLVNNTDLLFTDVTFNLSGGTINGGATNVITIAEGEAEDDMTITGGTINAPVILNAGANAAITNNFTLQDVFTVNGIVSHTNGSIFFQDGTININGTWIENPVSNNQFGVLGGTNLVNVNSTGFFEKEGSATFVFNVPLNNGGTIEVEVGNCILQSTTTNSGSLAIDPLAQLGLNGNLSLLDGTSMSGSGSFTQNGGTMLVNTNVALPNTLTFNFNNGIIDGTSLFTVNGIVNWNGGIISCPFTNAAGGTMNVTGGGAPVLQDILKNFGKANFGQSVSFQNGVFANYSLANLIANNSFQFSNTSGTNSVANEEFALYKKTGNASFFQNVPMNNKGEIDVTAGTFSHNQPLTSSGRIGVASSSFFESHARLANNLGIYYDGEGWLKKISGDFEVNTPLLLPIEMNFDLGSFARTIGSFPLTVRGNMNWAGTIENPVVIDPTFRIITATGTTPVLRNTLLVKGTAEVGAGSSISFQNGTLDVNANGILKVGSNVATPASGFFNSSGTNKIFIRHNAQWQKIGTQTFTNFISTDVDGTVKVDNGTFVQNGGTTALNNLFQAGINTIFRFGSPTTLNINQGAATSGAGNYEFFGTVNVNTNFQFPSGSNVFFKSGNWASAGSHKLTIAGSYTWEGGTSTVSKSIENGGAFKTLGVVTKNMHNNLTIGKGGAWQVGGTGYNFSNSLIDVKGIVYLNATPANPVSFSNTGGSNFSFSEGAVLRGINANSVTSINLPAYLNKTTLDGIGTMNFNSSLSGNFKITPAFSPGILTVNSTSPLLSDSTEMELEIQDGSGAGTGHDQLQRAGNLVLDGTLHVFQTGVVPLGSYTILHLTSGILSGSFDVVNLPPGYTIGQTATAVFVTKTANQRWKYRSKQTGNWKDILTWEKSLDGNNWSNATQVPTPFNAETITIRNGHTATVSENTTARQVITENGGTLHILSGYTLTVSQ